MNKAQNEQSEPAAPDVTPASETEEKPKQDANTQQPQEKEETAPIKDEAKEDNSKTPVTGEKKQSRAEKRIRKLTEQIRNMRQQSQPVPIAPEIEAGKELTIEEYQRHLAQQADAIAALRVEERMRLFEAENNLSHDVEVLPQKYPELDEKSSEYNPVLVEKIEQEYKRRVFGNGYIDHTVRLADIAKDYVEVARYAAKRSAAEAGKSSEELDDKTAPKPSGRKSEKAFEELSIKEMEERLGIVE